MTMPCEPICGLKIFNAYAQSLSCEAVGTGSPLKFMMPFYLTLLVDVSS